MDVNTAIQRISDAISDNLHGKSREKVVKALSKTPTPEAAAALLYRPARSAIEQAEKITDVDESLMFAVVTDGIDMMIEILQAMDKMENEDEFRKATLMAIMMIHAEQLGDDPEQQDIARQQLEQMAQDGSLQSAMQMLGADAEKAGMDTAEFEQGGMQMLEDAAPRQNPMAAGVRRGLES